MRMNSKVYFRLGIICILYIFIISCKIKNDHFSESNSFDSSLSTLAQKYYPKDQFAQINVEKIFNIIESHRKNDLFLNKFAPGTSSYRLDKVPFALYINERNENVDLLIFNLGNQDLEINKEWTAFYGNNVYIFKNVDINTIATQTDREGHLVLRSFISYLPGSELFGEFHDRSLPVNHELRQVLKFQKMILISPFKKWIESDNSRPYGTSLEWIFLHTIVHEGYHVFDNNDRSLRDNDGTPYLNMAKYADELKKKQVLEIFAAYYFSVIDYAKDSLLSRDSTYDQKSENKKIAIILGILKLIKSLDEKSLSADFMRFYEYAEGIATYTSMQTMLNINFESMEDIISYLSDSKNPNPFFYRTGALAGLLMFKWKKDLAFSLNNEYDTQLIWEKLLADQNIQPASTSDVMKYISGLSEESLQVEVQKVKYILNLYGVKI